ncbi:MAG: response regulator transcription factor [Chloroflexi bacterium]|nr:response regulator transcription factor [Chloroflexota bacterium]
MKSTPRILVVEDDWRIGAFLDRALSHRGYVVQVVREGGAALEVTINSQSPDLVILDLMLPDMDGLEVAHRLRSRSEIPILMLTARDTVADRVRGLDAGADDYLVKPFALEELLARVRAMLRRQTSTMSAQRRGRLTYHAIVLDRDTRETTLLGQRAQLRNREFELLSYFMRNPERALSRRELRDEVWGDDFPGDSNVIEVTVGNLRRRLEDYGLPRVIHTVRPIGYMLRWPTDP